MKILKILIALTIINLNSLAMAKTKEYQTDFDKNSNQKNIVIRISDPAVVEEDVLSIISYLEMTVSQGTVYKAGETLQTGFMMNKFEKYKKGRLILVEPDFKSLPIKNIKKMDYTFTSLRNQKDVVQSISGLDDFHFPQLVEGLMVHKDYKKLSTYTLERIEASGNTSGWWLLGQDDFVQDDYFPISIYQLAMDRPDLVKFLALPEEYLVYSEKGEGYRVFKDNSEMWILDGSYLDELNKTF